MYQARDKWFYVSTIAFIGILIYIIWSKIGTSKADEIGLSIFNLGFTIIGLIYYHFFNKKNALILFLVYISLFFTIRPLFLKPIWSILGFYFNWAFFIGFYFNFTKRTLIWSCVLFLLLATLRIYTCTISPYANEPFNFIHEAIGLFMSFSLMLYLIITYLEHLKQLDNELISNNTYLNTVMDNSPNMIYSIDKEGKVKTINSPLLNLLGITEEETIGKTKKEIKNLGPFFPKSTSIQEDEQILSGSQSIIQGQFGFKDPKSKDNIWFNFTKVPLVNDETKEIEGMLCVINDVTDIVESKRLVDEKNQELEKYIQSNLELESFAYLASHDLKTPLRSITSFSQLLEKSAKDKLDKNEKEFLKYITSSTHNMNKLITDMLEFSRVKNASVVYGDIDINDLMALLEIDFKVPAQAKNAQLKFTSKGDYIIKGDFLKIKQLLYNLISNALKYSKPNIDPVIHIHCEKRNKKYIFSVMDNGIGIDPEHHEKIFILLKRLHTNATYEGTGIGLAICKSIVDKHNGEIWLESKEGQGSTFYFSIPEVLS